jgi:hypothetical protein
MPQLVLLALAAVAVLMFKHAVADFYLQTAYQYLNKGKYGHPGGFIHVIAEALVSDSGANLFPHESSSALEASPGKRGWRLVSYTSPTSSPGGISLLVKIYLR